MERSAAKLCALPLADPKYPTRNTQMGEDDPPIPVHRPVPESVLLSPGRGNHLL